MPVSKNRRKGNRKPTGKSPSVSPSPALSPDQRKAVEQLIATLGSGDSPGEGLFGDGGGDDDPLWQAQQLIFEAWDAGTRRARIALARQALEISELCADAYGLLADEAASNIIEERNYYQQAVAAGEKAIALTCGPAAFTEDVGHFWGLLETRPYMRARMALAGCLWRLGERDDAIAHMQDLLRLNPDDNQGLRYLLTAWLLLMEDLDGAAALLANYPEEDFADWSHNQALLLFKQHGPTAAANEALKSAVKVNPHVRSLLLGAKSMPKTLPPHYSPGSKEEAVLYVHASADTWEASKGALQWLHDTTQNIVPKSNARR